MRTPACLLLLVGTVLAQAEDVGGATSLHGTRLQASGAALHDRQKPLPEALRATANNYDPEDAAQNEQLAFKDEQVKNSYSEKEALDLLQRIQDILQQEQKRLSWNRRSYAPMFVGKRDQGLAPMFVGKKDMGMVPLFVGKKQNGLAPMFVGRRGQVPMFVGRRGAVPLFVGTRGQAPMFVGKRESDRFNLDSLDNTLVRRGKRRVPSAFNGVKRSAEFSPQSVKRDEISHSLKKRSDKRFEAPYFVGKRFEAPYFVGKRHEAPYFVGRRQEAPFFVGRRQQAPYFVGKRQEAPYFVGKRQEVPYFVGKRFEAPYFVGKRQDESINDLLNALHVYEAARQYRRLIQADKRFDAPLFVGRRSSPPTQTYGEGSIDSSEYYKR